MTEERFPPATGPTLASVSPDALRRTFDQSFARPLERDAEETEDFVAIRLGPDHYALAVHDITGIAPDKTVVPLPPSRPGLLGIAGLNGRLVPVFSLARLFGQPAREEDRIWLAIAGREEPIGFAFDGFDGHLRIPRGALGPAPGRQVGLRPCIRHILRRDDEPPRPVIDLPRLVATLRAPARTAMP